MVKKKYKLLRLVMGSLVLAVIGVPPSAFGGGVLCAIRSGEATDRMVSVLRDRGPEGLADALRAYDTLQKQLQVQRAKLNEFAAAGYESKKESIAAMEAAIAGTNQDIERLAAVVDQVGRQRDCTVSRLYWYTDLEQAKAEAARTGRPILSLRMLGKLTDEYSCANSRFFRTALYTNKVVSDFMRTNFVLHWQSVRPVPRVTIDFGDGRKLERTITGNSAHYVLTSDGMPLDVLPGLYGPKPFLNWLTRTRKLHTEYLASDDADRADRVRRYHEQRRHAVYAGWFRDLQRLGEDQVTLVDRRINDAIDLAYKTKSASPIAVAASQMAETKTAVEAPLLRFAGFSGPWIEHGMDDDLWNAIARLHRDDVRLDEPSIKLIRRESPNAAVAGRISVTKSAQEDPVLRMARAFEDSMTLDTVRNEYVLHRRIHEQFADGNAVTNDVNTLNEWVYAELFLTPSNDPWLGLAPRDVYTALEGDGRTEPTVEVTSSSGGQ